MTKQREEHLATLQEIRSLMERSSRFLSLSGLSGVVAGSLALVGAAVAFAYLGLWPFTAEGAYYPITAAPHPWGLSPLAFFALDAALVLTGALAGGIYFTTRRARRQGLPIWDALTRRLLLHLLIPLVAGGLFVAALYLQGVPALIAPATLIFYGLALINASKYTLDDVRYLGMAEVALGLIGAFAPGYGLELWAIGFGVLHILYGILMYRKHEREG